MPYLVHIPHTLLKPHIDKIYILEHSSYLAAPTQLPSVANCCSAMVLNYGDRYRLHSDLSVGTLLPASFLSGFSSRAYRLELAGRVSMLGVIFRGVGLRAFFSSVDLGELTDQRHELSAIIGSDAERLCNQLAEAPTNEDRFALIETSFAVRQQGITSILRA